MIKILILNFIVMVNFNFAHPVTPDMLIDKGTPLYLNGILYALMSLSMFLFSPFWGQKVDEKGTKRFLVLGPTFYGIMQLLLGFAPSAILMGIGRFLAGVFSAAWIVALLQHVNIISPKEKKARNFGYIMVTNGLAGVVGQLIAGQIGARGGIYIYVPFILQFIFGIVISILVLFVVKNQQVVKQSQAKSKRSIRSSIQLIRDTQITAIILVMLMLAIASNLYTSHIGFYVAEVYNFKSIGVSLINSYSNFITMLANLILIGYIKKHFGILKGIKYEFIVGLVAFSTIFFLPINTAIIFIGFFIAAVAIYRPLIQDYVISKNKENGGELMGVINSVNSLGMILGSLTSGFLFNYGTNLPFYAVMVVLAIGLGIFQFKLAK